MTTHPQSTLDTAALAATVRSLASQAHRVLNDPKPPRHLLAILGHRVALLDEQIPTDPTNPLREWLDSLRQRLEQKQREAAWRNASARRLRKKIRTWARPLAARFGA